MALTSEQINEIRAKDKLPPIESLPTTSPTVDRAKELQDAWGTEKKKSIIPGAQFGGSGELGVGIAKGVGSTLRGIGEIGTKVLDTATSFVPGEIPKDIQSGADIYRPETVTGSKVEEALQAKTPTEKAGKFIEQTAEFFVPAGVVGKVEKILAEGSKGTQLVTKLASLVGQKTAEKIASVGTKATVRAIEGGGVVAAQTGGDAEQTKEAGLISAAFPVVGATLTGIKEAIKSPAAASRVINSLIKPLIKDFSYGKNPGRAVAEEGITASSLDELGTKIGQRRQEIGSEIGEVMAEVGKQGKNVNLGEALKPLDEAIARANKSPRTNKALIQRLENAKADLLQGRKLENMTPEEAFAFKQDVADITKFTGNASDDAAVNKSLKYIYGNIKSEINKIAKGVKSKTGKSIEELNEKYADLSSAEIATKYRNNIEARQNLVSLPQNVVGFGTGLVAALSSGGAAIPAILAGTAGAVMEKALSTPKVKTRLAKWMAEAPPEEKKKVFDLYPAFRGAVIKAFVGE